MGDTIENENAREYVRVIAASTQDPSAGRPLEFEEQFPDAEPAALDLLARLLIFDPRARLSAADALSEHIYLRDMHEANPTQTPTPLFEYSFEACGVTEASLKTLVWRELSRFHPEVGEAPPES